jgi:hypothetical protein
VTATIAAVSKPTPARTTLARVKALPWTVLLEVGLVFGRRWSRLSAKDRARITHLVRQSRGRPSNLSGRERAELRKLLRKLDIRAIARELPRLMRRTRRRRRLR